MNVDLSEAIEAANQAITRRHPLLWQYVDKADIALLLEAAAPVIAKAVREQIANNELPAILVAHQRHTFDSCLCGWNELGASHPMHIIGEWLASGQEVACAECGRPWPCPAEQRRVEIARDVAERVRIATEAALAQTRARGHEAS